MCPTFSQVFAKHQFKNIEGKRKYDVFVCLCLSFFLFFSVFVCLCLSLSLKCVSLFPFENPQFRNIEGRRCTLHNFTATLSTPCALLPRGRSMCFIGHQPFLSGFWLYRKSLILPLTFYKCIPQQEWHLEMIMLLKHRKSAKVPC